MIKTDSGLEQHKQAFMAKLRKEELDKVFQERRKRVLERESNSKPAPSRMDAETSSPRKSPSIGNTELAEELDKITAQIKMLGSKNDFRQQAELIALVRLHMMDHSETLDLEVIRRSEFLTRAIELLRRDVLEDCPLLVLEVVS